MNESASQMGTAGCSEVDIVKFDASHPSGYARRATVIEERPLHIRVDNATYTLLRTPGNDRELVIGFCFTEGLIRNVHDVLLLNQCPDSEDTINVRTVGGGERPERSLLITSSCGMCGVENLEAMLKTLGRVDTRLEVPVSGLYNISDAVRASQRLFGLTGGTHAAAAFGADCAVVGVQEDVGRHNALDKLIGHVLLRGNALSNGGVFLSGRTSLEMVAKAVRAGIPLLVSVGAPTTLAIALAERTGITLCGFLRHAEISIYTHGWRIAA